MSLKKIQTKLKYEFKNIELLELALTHKSSNNFLNAKVDFLNSLERPYTSPANPN